MKRKLLSLMPSALAILTLALLGLIYSPTNAESNMAVQQQSLLARRLPAAPKLDYSPHRTAPIEVSRIFGRTAGCAEASPEFIGIVARQAIVSGVDARLLAAIVAVESGCNQYAISSRGAVGYTQVMPRVWKDRYDFAAYNLFKPEDNLRVGGEILSDLVRTYGVREAVRRYQGVGEGCESCDMGYTAKILNLSGRK